MKVDLNRTSLTKLDWNPDSCEDFESRRSIAQSVLGGITWESDEEGHLKCPGQHIHTSPTHKKDCTIFVDGVPNIFCFHQSCREEVAKINQLLKSEIRDEETITHPNEITTREKLVSLPRTEPNRFEYDLITAAKTDKPYLIKKYNWDPADAFEESPTSIGDNPNQEWRLLLGLYEKTDIIWIGKEYSSGKPEHAKHFKTVSEWLDCEKIIVPFTCPSIFKPGSYSRSKDQILAQRYLVVESDDLSHEESCSLFKWMRQFMRLRAIINTGGKSLHAWFEPPNSEQEAELRIILPALGFDSAMFRLSQPCRLPGVVRLDAQKDPLLGLPVYQSLLWLDLEGIA